MQTNIGEYFVEAEINQRVSNEICGTIG